jgi:hypothetical protein
MTKKNKVNYVDALETAPRFAVLTKPGRIEILVQPTAKGLRTRGKRGWRLFRTVDNRLSDAGHVLTEAIQQALQEMESTNEAAKPAELREPSASEGRGSIQVS